MGFLDKVKNMFVEEVEEEPIKKDVIQVEIPAPAKPQPQPKPIETVEEKEPEVKVSENKIVEREEKPAGPIFFDDNDFKTLEKPKEVIKPKKKLEDRYKKEEEKKVFAPTPIISPVYGILDKNYKKEDIKPKRQPVTTTYYEAQEMTIDDVRKKAYGTLEDELETTLMPEEHFKIEEDLLNLDSDTPKDEDNMLEKFMDDDYKPRFASHGEEVPEEVNEVKEESDLFEEMHDETVVDKKEEDNLSESDLFNLIDSMYDKKDDE